MRGIQLLLVLCCGAHALLVERSIPSGGSFTVTVSHIPAREPVSALRLRIYLKSSATVTALTLQPGSAGIWSQVPPEMKRDGRILEVTALAPNQSGLSATSRLGIFRLGIQLADARDTASAIDSVSLLEALDARTGKLRLPLQIVEVPVGVIAAASPDQNVRVRQVDRMHDIDFFLAKSVAVRGRVLDARGTVIRKLDEGQMPPGRHRIRWDGRDQSGALAPMGNYFLELKLGPNTYHKQVRHAL